MDDIFSKCQTIGTQFAAVTQLYSACLSSLGGKDCKDRDELVKWEKEKMKNILASTFKISRADAPCLVQIAERDPQEYLTKYVQIIQLVPQLPLTN